MSSAGGRLHRVRISFLMDSTSDSDNTKGLRSNAVKEGSSAAKTVANNKSATTIGFIVTTIIAIPLQFYKISLRLGLTHPNELMIRGGNRLLCPHPGQERIIV